LVLTRSWFSRKQTVRTRGHFVGDRNGDQIDGSHGLGLRLAQPRFQCSVHAAQAELAEGVLQFSDVVAVQ